MRNIKYDIPHLSFLRDRVEIRDPKELLAMLEEMGKSFQIFVVGKINYLENIFRLSGVKGEHGEDGYEGMPG